MKIDWAEGFEILVRADARSVTLSANQEGLLSLSEQLSALAREDAGSHIHYDEFNALEEGSAELIIEKR